MVVKKDLYIIDFTTDVNTFLWGLEQKYHEKLHVKNSLFKDCEWNHAENNEY